MLHPKKKIKYYTFWGKLKQISNVTYSTGAGDSTILRSGIANGWRWSLNENSEFEFKCKGYIQRFLLTSGEGVGVGGRGGIAGESEAGTA